MRVINADVLFSILDDRIKEAEEDARHAKRDVVAERADAVLSALESLKADVEDNAPTIDAVPVEIVCEMFGNEVPCNYGLFGVSVDDFMMSKCGKWCEDNCDKVPYTECWRKFFEAIEKWRKHNG